MKTLTPVLFLAAALCVTACSKQGASASSPRDAAETAKLAKQLEKRASAVQENSYAPKMQPETLPSECPAGRVAAKPSVFPAAFFRGLADKKKMEADGLDYPSWNPDATRALAEMLDTQSPREHAAELESALQKEGTYVVVYQREVQWPRVNGSELSNPGSFEGSVAVMDAATNTAICARPLKVAGEKVALSAPATAEDEARKAFAKQVSDAVARTLADVTAHH